METPLLTTKLYIPPTLPTSSLVLRPRLIQRLNEGSRSGCKLTLISAPAGFGKTTLVSEWVNQKDEYGMMNDASGEGAVHHSSSTLPPFRVAWLSLDEGDNDPTRLLAYLVAALQTIEENIGKGALSALQATRPQPPPASRRRLSGVCRPPNKHLTPAPVAPQKPCQQNRSG